MTKKPVLCSVRFLPDDRVVEVEKGASVLSAGQKAGVYVSSLCGGDGICGKCRLILRSGEIQSQPTTLLSRKEILSNYILACQSSVESDLEVEVPPETQLEKGRILGDEDAERFGRMALEDRIGFVLAPLVRKHLLKLDAPTMESPIAYDERVQQALQSCEPDASLLTTPPVIHDLNRLSKFIFVNDGHFQVTATVGDCGATTQILHIVPGDTTAKHFGIAVDIGTTTVVCQLVDLNEGRIVDSEAKYNSQMKYGEDYIRRIMYAKENNAHNEMQQLVLDDLNELIGLIVLRNKAHTNNITCAVCAGNTAMIHFLVGLDTGGIRRAPYVPVANYVPPMTAEQVGLRINPRGLVYSLPSVAAYVGSDITAGAVAVGLDEQEDLTLFIDVGTNGEVVLGNRDWMVCCSASAGPAFEGVGVEYGMRASRGAIEHFRIISDDEVEIETIGNRPPRGICGSGFLDLLAELFRAGFLGRNGKFQESREGKRLVKRDGAYEFIVVPEQESAVDKAIVVTQADVSNLIRSKAAIYAAISILIESVGVQLSDIQNVLLAGGFGNYLDVAHAITLGMLPDAPRERVHFVGNTCISGARAALLSGEALARIERVGSMMTYVDLMTNPKYMDEFVSANFIPHTDLNRFPTVEAGAGIKGSASAGEQK